MFTGIAVDAVITEEGKVTAPVTGPWTLWTFPGRGTAILVVMTITGGGFGVDMATSEVRLEDSLSASRSGKKQP